MSFLVMTPAARPDYFDGLKRINLEWRKTGTPDPNAVLFTFVRTEGEVRRVEFPERIYLDES
jgi:hypothetical protein